MGTLGWDLPRHQDDAGATRRGAIDGPNVLMFPIPARNAAAPIS